MGIEAPIPINTKLGDFNNVFRRIASAAEHPHLSIPETEAGRSRKQYHKLINRSLMFVSGMMIVSGVLPSSHDPTCKTYIRELLLAYISLCL